MNADARRSIDDAQVFSPDLWATHAKFFPEKEASICGNIRRKWGDFERNTSPVTNRLIDEGIERGDKNQC